MDKLLNTKLFLLDMDGTLYLGDEVFDGAVDFIDTVKKSGREYIYLTNNSSRAGVDYITRLRKLGFPCEKENVFTSGMATAMYLNTRASLSILSELRHFWASLKATAFPLATVRRSALSA